MEFRDLGTHNSKFDVSIMSLSMSSGYLNKEEARGSVTARGNGGHQGNKAH